MKNRPFYILFFAGLLLLCNACSVKKNNAATRSFHFTKAKYNVMFNGETAFREGEEAVIQANKDDYNEVLPIYPISRHENAKACTAQMERCIEKCQKTIKLHSIVKKPKSKPGRRKDSKYRAFMAKEEYNRMVQEAWLLMGKAQFYQLDFTAASASFLYAIRHYSDNEDVYTYAKLWLARSYAEMGWFYEAEDVLNKMNEKTFIPATSKAYVQVKSDVLLKQKKYMEVLPYLETAVVNAKRKDRARLTFIYAQVQERLGNYAEAFAQYDKVRKLQASYELRFNALLNKSRCYQGEDVNTILAQLNHLLKAQSNLDFQDQIYYAMGELYSRNGQEDKAVDSYRKAIDYSTRDGIDKAKVLLALGKIYYEREQYIAAQPLYDEALPLLPLTYENYKGLSLLRSNLDEVARNLLTVQLEDSLQALAALPEAEQLAQVRRVIAEEDKAAEEAVKKMEEEARQQLLREETQAVNQVEMGAFAAQDQSWYFYNSNLVSRGKLEFKRVWGSRIPEDDWRRSNKQLNVFDEENDALADAEAGIPADSTVVEQRGKTKPSSQQEDSRIAAYLKNIPTTEARMKASNQRLEEALHQLVYLFDEKIVNLPLSQFYFEELQRRFPTYEELPADYYRMYLQSQRLGEDLRAGQMKETLLKNYPENAYTALLQHKQTRDEDAIQREEALYQDAYQAYKQGAGVRVRSDYKKAQQEFPESRLMPKFMLLDAVSNARTDGDTKFRENLRSLMDKYPDSDVTRVARGMIALSTQGREVKSTTPGEGLQAQRQAVLVTQEEFAENIQKAGFRYEPESPHRYVLLLHCSPEEKNRVVFAIASYNFTRFVIKTFQMESRELREQYYLISVSGLSSLDEAVWYQKELHVDTGFQQSLKDLDYQEVTISEENARQVIDPESVERYLEFYRQNNLDINDQQRIREMEQNTGFVKP